MFRCHPKSRTVKKILQPTVLTIQNYLLFIPMVHSVLDTAQQNKEGTNPGLKWFQFSKQFSLCEWRTRTVFSCFLLCQQQSNNEKDSDVAEGSSYGVFSSTIPFSLPVGTEKHWHVKATFQFIFTTFIFKAQSEGKKDACGGVSVWRGVRGQRKRQIPIIFPNACK